MADTEIHLSLENDLLKRTKKAAAELGIDEARLVETTVRFHFGEAEHRVPETAKKQEPH